MRWARIGGAAATVLLALLVVVAPSLTPSAAAAPRAGKSIIGGSPADPAQWGFTASVVTPHSLCTGSVIAPDKVLTAAHCVLDIPGITVRTNTASAFGGGESSSVGSAVINPAWARSFNNDVAVLTLNNPTTATPIQLADPAEDAIYTRPGSVLTAAGFGTRNPGFYGKPKLGLLHATPVFVHGFCSLPIWAICDAGGRSGLVASQRIGGKVRKRPVLKGVCAGDSGGPLVASTPLGLRLIGIAEATSSPPKRSSFGFVRCNLKGFPSLHTRVVSHLNFIEGNIEP